MKKNSNSLLFTIMGGAIFCFVFLGLAFVTTNNTRVMKGNSDLLNEVVVDTTEEVALGDIMHCVASTSGSCSYTYSTVGVYTIGTSSSNSTPPSSCSAPSTPYNENSPSVYYSGCHVTGTVAAPTDEPLYYWAGTQHVKQHSCREGTCTKCELGFLLADDGSSCSICPAGYACNGTTAQQRCENGTSSNGAGKSECTPCTGKAYSNKAPGGVNNACSICDGIVDDAHTTCTPCTGANDYVVNNQCVSCQTGYEATDTYPQCHLFISKGKYLVSGTTTLNSCPAGTYSDEVGTWSQDGNCISGTCIVGASNCKSCGLGKTSPAGSISEDQCTVDCALIEDENKCIGQCKWNNVTNKCGINEDAIVLVGGNTTAYVTPAVCKVYTISVQAAESGLPVTGTVNWTVSGDDGHDCSGTRCSVKVCGKGCYSNPSVTVTANYNGHYASTTISRAKYTEWSKTNWDRVPDNSNNVYIYNGSALINPTCVGYSDPYVEDGITKYHYRYNRCCGSSSAKCYIDENSVYHWTKTPESSWKTVSKTESECVNKDACFEKPDGTRLWGKYYDQIVNGYKLITAIKDENICKNPTENDACYVNNNDPTDYQWSTTALEGYTKKDDVTKAEDCQPAVCYLNLETNKYVIGKYENDGKYAKVYDEEDKLITDIAKCKAPTEEACYKDKATGKYAWGEYSNDSNYELITSITSKTICTNEVPVPATGINVSKLVYIFMAILMACGVGFIYYSSVAKKEN